MKLNNRLKALVRATPRGKTYPVQALENAINVFIDDVDNLVGTLILNVSSDEALLNNYFNWEKILFSNVDNPEGRQMMLSCSLYLNVIPTDIPEVESTNVIKLFKSSTIH